METIPCIQTSYSSPNTLPTMPTSLNVGTFPHRHHFKTQHKAVFVYAMKVHWAVPLQLSTRWVSSQLHIPATLNLEDKPPAPTEIESGWSPPSEVFMSEYMASHVTTQDSNVQGHSTSYVMGTTALWTWYICTAVSSNSTIKHYDNSSGSYLDLEVMTAAVSGGSGDLALGRTACRVELE